MRPDRSSESELRGPRFSLQARVFLLVAILNGAVFGAGLIVFTQRLTDERRNLTSELLGQLAYTVEPTIRAGGDLNVGQLLRWPSWILFEDAVLCAASWGADDGRVVPRGAYLNPVGRARRSATFDEQGVLRAIQQAVGQREVVSGVGGVAFPLEDAEGDVWGGCWFVVSPQGADGRELFWRLLPWFVGSTLLLTLGTFTAMRRFVLGPVRQLAEGSQRVSAGDFSVRLPVPRRRDELADLIRGFNEMTSTVHEYNERLAHQVDVATKNVRRAEAAAMTQRRLAATGELAAGVAHEINNPLGGLLNAVETLSREDLPEPKRAQYHDLLRGGLERIRSTVGQLLRFTPRATRTGPVPLAGPVGDALALVRHRAEQEGVTLLLRAADEAAGGTGGGAKGHQGDDRDRIEALPPVVGEANEIGQAVLNLLVNSLDALGTTPGGGTITVTLGQVDPEHVRIVVEDDGPGVEPAELQRVADLFYTTKEAGKGSGLGLAIVHNVVASHGGRIELDSADGGGFRVTIDLPVWNGDEPSA